MISLERKPMKPIQWIRNKFGINRIFDLIMDMQHSVISLTTRISSLEKLLIKSQKLPAYITIQDGDRTFVTKLCWLGPGESKEVWIQPDIEINTGAVVSIFAPFYMSQVREANICLVGNYPDMTRECKIVEKITPAMKFISVINYPVPDGN